MYITWTHVWPKFDHLQVSYMKMKLQLQILTYGPEDDQPLVETCSYVIYTTENQQIVSFIVIPHLIYFVTQLWKSWAQFLSLK
jgi:hypothetical protein